MIWIAIVCWFAALLVLAYDASGNAVARRIGPLYYAAALSGLPFWKLTICAVAPWICYAALVLAAYFAFQFWGLLALGAGWFASFNLGAAVWMRAVSDGSVEIDDYLPTRWLHLALAVVLAIAATVFALLAI
ncbi:hypothetical protein [Brevundimonas sp. SH203]|uniref:hypothetical protein n=1 Tax=Brevundimonas sp. SH203 TaxID=345167 RepID=UPI000B36370C|nr:hypothetical protein [Brevundimonas sp. SH203]